MRALRLLFLGWLLHFKAMSRSPFNGFLAVLWPLFFATIAFLMYRSGGGGEPLVFASLGASVMGIWSATSTSASQILQRERRHGTLEVLVAAPVHFSLVLLPISIAMSTVGLYSMAATLLWGRFVFGIDVPLDHPAAFVAAVPATIVSIGMLGFLLSVAFVRYRTAWALGNMLEYPVWLVCGFLVPLSLLPGWVRPISWILAPTWGVRAIREAALGGTPLPDLALTVVIGLAYALVGVLLVDTFLRAARVRAALSLT